MQRSDYIVDPATGCWVWQKGTRNGYARGRRDGKLVSMHVWYWEQRYGPAPEGLDLDHTCHNGTGCPGGTNCPHRRCVNPDHLEPVTRAVNVQRGAVGRLTPTQVVVLRHSDSPIAVLTARYGVCKGTVDKIRSGETWGAIGKSRVPRVVLGKPQPRGVELTDEQTAKIRAAPRRHGIGRELAHRFGVSDAVISRIRKE